MGSLLQYRKRGEYAQGSPACTGFGRAMGSVGRGTMKKLLLIVNPCAGQKKARRFLMDMIAILNRGEYTVLVHVTAAPGDGEAAALAYAGEVDRILCCGGDGTFNEVVSGLLKSGVQIPLGYIPAGSTNDFAASLKLSANLLQATRDTVTGSPVKLDVGSFNGRYFSYVASFGLFTKVSYATPQSVKNILGHAAYALGGIQELSQLRSYPLRFALEDGTVIEDSFIFGAVSNTFRVGGILTLDAAQVDMSDGCLELLLIRTPRNLLELSECVRALQQKNYNDGLLTFVKTAALTVSAPEKMPWTLDGELEAGHSQIEIRCIHHAISVIAPQKKEKGNHAKRIPRVDSP